MQLSHRFARQRVALSRQEMCMISQAINRDFAPRLFASRFAQAKYSRFTPQELFDISQQISRDYAPRKQAQTSRLVLLAVSPTRLHAYWPALKRRMSAAGSQPSDLTLRVYAYPAPQVEEQPAAPPQAASWFDVAVDAEQEQQVIVLPASVASNSPMQYHAELGALDSQQILMPQLVSSPVKLTYAEPNPMLTDEMPAIVAALSQPIHHLSSSTGKTASGQGKLTV